jgi:TRAP-type C4-dicarboxylate transport system permease small subunit
LKPPTFVIAATSAGAAIGAVDLALAVGFAQSQRNECGHTGKFENIVMQFVETLALKLIRAFLGTVLLASVVLICVNAFGRYVLAAPVIWAEEVLGYALVWVVYLGAVQVTDENGHLRMDLLMQYLPPRLRRLFEIFGHLVFLAVSALIIYQSFDSIAQFGHRSQVAGLPMNVLHLMIPVSFGLMFLLVLGHLWRIIHQPVDGNSPEISVGTAQQ